MPELNEILMVAGDRTKAFLKSWHTARGVQSKGAQMGGGYFHRLYGSGDSQASAFLVVRLLRKILRSGTHSRCPLLLAPWLEQYDWGEDFTRGEVGIWGYCTSSSLAIITVSFQYSQVI